MQKQDRNCWIIGFHALEVQLARDPSAVRTAFLLEKRRDLRMEKLKLRLKHLGISIQLVHFDILTKWTKTQAHQGVGAIVRPPEALSETTFLAELKQQSTFTLLILDGVHDPRNLGACLRTAAAADVYGVILPKHRSAPLSPTTSKTAAGAATLLRILRPSNLVQFIQKLQLQEVTILGMCLEAEKNFYDLQLPPRLAIVLGAEDKGLRLLTKKNCDLTAYLPMHNHIASLNVSVAAGICLFERVRAQNRYA